MKLIRHFLYAKILLAFCLFIVPTHLLAESATYDDLTERPAGSSITNDGVTFFGLDNGLPGLDSVFIIERADGDLSSNSSFSGENGLTSSSMTPGSEAGYGPVKELSITTGKPAGSASIEVFTVGTSMLKYGNTVTLEAIKGDNVVHSESVAMIDVEADHFTLTVQDVEFDSLKISSAPNAQALLFDNVTINSAGINDVDGDCDMDGSDLATAISQGADADAIAGTFGQPALCNN